MSEPWGESVTVLLHRIPESKEYESSFETGMMGEVPGMAVTVSEEYEGGFEAVTMGGVPGMAVTISASDRDSKEEAFERLREGLRAFGFAGTLAVVDATGLGRPVRYEVGIG